MVIGPSGVQFGHKSHNKLAYHEYGLKTELDDTKSYYQLIMKITISKKRRIAKIGKKGKICIKKLTKEA